MCRLQPRRPAQTPTLLHPVRRQVVPVAAHKETEAAEVVVVAVVAAEMAAAEGTVTAGGDPVREHFRTFYSPTSSDIAADGRNSAGRLCRI
jgi:hypothetical protein